MKDEKDEQNGHSNLPTDTDTRFEGGAFTMVHSDTTPVSQASPDPGIEDDDDALEDDDSDVIEDDDEEEEDFDGEDDDIDGDADNDVIGDDDDDAHTGERGGRKDPDATLF